MTSTTATDKPALIVGHIQPPMTGLIQDPEFVPRLKDTIDAAHKAGIQVIFLHTSFRANLAEFADGSWLKETLKETPFLIDGVSNPFDETVAPQEQDAVVKVSRISGFVGSDLDLVLRAQGIDRIVLTGISTGGVVLGTLTDALQTGYNVTVLTDLVEDPNPDIHEAVLKLVGGSGMGLPWVATLQTSGEWKASIA